MCVCVVCVCCVCLCCLCVYTLVLQLHQDLSFVVCVTKVVVMFEVTLSPFSFIRLHLPFHLFSNPSSPFSIHATIDSVFFLSQFVRDQFLYNQTVAMELLISCGLKEQLLELAKVQ